MSSIVIALPKIEDAKKIRSVLERHGFTVAFRMPRNLEAVF